VYRPYTPVSEEETVGHIDFVVKGYENGTASKYIHALKPGDKMQVWGPIPGMKYQANKFECIGLIAGGSGITPMVSVIPAS
jgi:cytochrome-b5 reductase